MKLKGNRWEDHFSRRAKKERYPARSVFKLQEIQRKYRLIHPGDTVLDLGCAPGSWLLYVAELVGKKGEVIGIDIQPVTVALPAQVRVHSADVLSMDQDGVDRFGDDFNAVLSDMAPATTGVKDVDAVRSYELCGVALSTAQRCLKPGGAFVCKMFHGEEFNRFREAVRKAFIRQITFKPQSSRKASSEIYFIGIGKRA